MLLVSRALWSLVGLLALACLAPVNAAGLVEVNVVFPRQNETYAPTDKFPLVLALQNVAMAKHLDFSVDSMIWYSSTLDGLGPFRFHLDKANGSSEPYFAYRYTNMLREGPYHMAIHSSWSSCDVNGDEVSIVRNSSNFGVRFNIKKGAQEVDLVTATANDKPCYGQHGLAFNVTDRTHDVPEPPKFGGDYDPLNPPLSGTCAVLTSPSPTTTTNPCAVSIDSAAAASMSAVLHAALCKGINPPADCPEENAVQQLAVAGVAVFAAALGAIGFLLA